MQQQDLQDQPAPATHGIEAAPPAYSPQPAAEPHGGAVVDQPPAPVKDLPTDLNTTQEQLPVSAATKRQAPGVVPLNQLGDQPQWIDCPFCQRRTMTRLNTEGTPMQLVAGVLCCMLCVCLACVPCMAGWFEETTYFCSQCNKKVAKRPESGAMIVYGPAAVVPSKYAQG